MSGRRENLRQFAVHAALASTSGVLLALGDALVAARKSGNAALAVWVAIGCVTPVAAAWGLLQKPLLSGSFRGLTRLGVLERFSLYTSHDRTGPRGPTVLAHALGFLGVVLTGVLLAFVLAVRVGLRAIQDETMQEVLLLVALGFLVLGLALLLALLTPPVSRLVARFDERFGLPWPRSPLIRFLALVFVPTVAVALPLGIRYGEDLGNALLPFELAVFLEIEVVVYLLFRSVRPSYQHRFVVGALATFLVIAAAQPATFTRSRAAKTVSARGALVPRAVRLLRRATDFDRDGFSGFYAGGDCAPLDRRINPQAQDVPGNGRDEDCDGADATATSIERGPVFSSAVEPSLIKKHNVVWIIVDALRPDSMNLYGAKRHNTPALNELARSALQFDEAFAPSTTTHLSIPCMLTGKNADRATWEYFDDKRRVHLTENTTTLANRLQSHGYRTGAIVSPHIHGLRTALSGFDKVLSVSSYRHDASHAAPVTTALGIEFLQRDSALLSGKKAFFLLVYYEDPHKPYDRHGARFPDYGKNDKDRYDGEIAYTDAHIGSFLDYLGVHKRLWDDTIVIVTSDHGEEFEEHGSTSHGKTCYEESAHVPLLVRIPGVATKTISRRVSLVDIVPTVLELVGAPADPSGLDGQSLLFAERDEGAARPSFCAITNQGGNAGRPFFNRSVRFGDRSLIHDVLRDTFELYDVTADRPETRNIIGNPAESATVDRLKRMLVANASGNLFQLRIQ
jgi:arylsulfatase A-like enzyme